MSEIEPDLQQHNLIGTQNIHGFDLSTSDVVMMEKADIVIGLNLELEPWLERVKVRTFSWLTLT